MRKIVELVRNLWNKYDERLSNIEINENLSSKLNKEIEDEKNKCVCSRIGFQNEEDIETSIDEEESTDKNIFLYSNSDAYAGELQMSKRNGWGVFLKYTGQKFEGLWKDNERNGFGMQTIGSTIKYIGQFKNNECDGDGIIFHQSGLLYSSRWCEGELIERRLIFEDWHEDFLSLFLDEESRLSHNNTIDKEDVNDRIDMNNVNNFKLISNIDRVSHTRIREDLFRIEINCDYRNYNSENMEKDSKNSKNLNYSERIKDENEYQLGYTRMNKDKILKTLSEEIGNRALKCYNKKNSAENCLNWDVYQLAYFIKCIGLSEYVKLFILNELDGSTLPYISIDDLKDMGILQIFHLKYIHMSFTLLLKLRLRCIRKQTFSPQRLIDDEYLRSFEIPANELSLKCRIGEGGYGKVYKAIWLTRGITVAVKAFRRRDKAALAREFYSELTIVSRIRHPNVTLFLGVVMSPLYCLVTELVPYGSLFDLLHIKNVLLTSTQLLKISREICCGMAYLHENGVLHCDLKSSNILLSNNFNVKIGDFGLSTLMESPLETRKMLGCVGTHHWMAPEILRGEGFTKAADVYSFGMILWEMITKRIPHEDLTINHIIASVGYGNRRPLIPKNIPSSLRNIIRRTWHKNVQKRPNFKQLTNIFEQLYQTSILDIEENLLAFFGQ